MKSYIDTTRHLNEQIAQLSREQANVFVKNVMQVFVKELPTDWYSYELLEEQAFYQTLAQLLLQDRWDLAQIRQQVDELDNIMDTMGEDYPHTTGAYALSLLSMVDYYIQFADHDEDFQGYVMGVADEIMNMAQWQAQADDLDHWLEYPKIATTFNRLKTHLRSIRHYNE